MSKFLDLLKEKIIVFDGAMGVSLQVMNLSIDDWGGPQFENCSENLLYTRPDAVEKVHTSFLDIGCDVIETNSFGGSEVVLTEAIPVLPSGKPDLAALKGGKNVTPTGTNPAAER